MKYPVSAVLITKNEEKRIGATLDALQWCDEIIVVDSGSIDTTVAICTAKGCKVTHHPFENFGKQKQLAVSLAKNNWVLAVDADEMLTPALSKEIPEKLFSQNNPYKGYKIKMSHVFMGKVLRFGGESNKTYLRLFDKTAGQFNDKAVHEEVILTGETAVLKNRIMHYSYEDLQDYFTKFNQYTSMAANKLADKKPKATWYIGIKFFITFFQLYFIRGLILDGYNGFVWAMVSSFYPFIKYAKHRELKS